MLASGRLYANFYTRLSPDCDDCRRRLEKALGLKSSGVLELVLNEFESRFVGKLSNAQRQEYFKGALNASQESRASRKKMPRHKTGARQKISHDSDSTAFRASQ